MSGSGRAGPATGRRGADRDRGEEEPRTIRCGFCGIRFVEDRSQPACAACPLLDACHFVRCPECGYENPAPVRRRRRARGKGGDGDGGGGGGGRRDRRSGCDGEPDETGSFLRRCVKWWRSP